MVIFSDTRQLEYPATPMSALSEPLVHRPQRTKVDDCPEAPNDQHPHPHMQQDPPPSRRCLQSRAADSPSPENLGYDGNEVEQAENEYSYNYDDAAHHCHPIVTISLSAIGSRRRSPYPLVRRQSPPQLIPEPEPRQSMMYE